MQDVNCANRRSNGRIESESSPRSVIDQSRISEFPEAVLDSITAQVAVIDQDGTIIFTNQAWIDFRTTISRNAMVDRGTRAGRENYLEMCEAFGTKVACKDKKPLRVFAAFSKASSSFPAPVRK